MIELFLKQIKKYPHMQPCDAVKLLYQQSFAGGHMITDMDKCMEWLDRERSTLKLKKDKPLFEYIGEDMWRINLDSSEAERIPARHILNAFADSSKIYNKDYKVFEYKLSKLRELCAEEMFDFDMKELDMYLSIYEKEGYPPVSHSDEYRNLYDPHYRVINFTWKSAIEIYLRIEKLRAEKDKIIVVIDGNAASGKTTLAEKLAMLFACDVIHMDDFFLPFEKRTEERLSEAGGNIDYERFAEEVLPNLDGKAFEYRVFNCGNGEYDELRAIRDGKIIIVEGAYAMHPYFGRYYDFSIFNKIDAEVQKKRILERNGNEFLKIFLDKWIPMENKYFEKFDIESMADMLLKASNQNL